MLWHSRSLANLRFPVHTSAGVAREDFSTAVNDAFIYRYTLPRLKWDWESLRIKGGECRSTFIEHCELFWHRGDPHAPLSNKCLRDSQLFKVECNPDVSKAFIEILGSQPRAWCNNIMKHVSPQHAMLISNKQLMHMTIKRMDGKQREGGGRRSNYWCCYACGEVGHNICTCLNKEKVLDTSKETNTAVNKGTDMKEKEKEWRRGSLCRCDKGGYRGRSGGTWQRLRFA